MIFDKKYSRCAVDAKKIVSKELGNEHILLNDSKAAVYQFRIDGDIETGSEERCDYMVEAEGIQDRQVYVIELKGSDLNKAVRQIEKTIQRYSGRLKGYKILPRITIHKASTHDLRGMHYRNLKRAYPLTITKTRKYEERL